MKIFIDTGNFKEIEALVPLGIIDGVTTNPTLMAKEGGDPKQILKKICDLVQGPVSGEVVATDYEGMVREGRDLGADQRAHRGQGAVHPGRRARLQDAVERRPARQRDAGVLADAGAHRGQGRARRSSARSSAGSTTSPRRAWA